MAASRRRALLGLAALLTPGAVRAEPAWPSQPIKMVVPYPPGALTDVLGRLVGERISAAFGQPVIVDNKAGAATQLGAAYVAKQPADGYTLLLATVTTLCISPALYAKPLIAYTDFAGVAMLGNVTLILVCRPDLPVGDPQELVGPAAGQAGRLLLRLARSRHGAPSAGRIDPLPRECSRRLHVPYLGSTKALVDLMEGRFDFMFLDATVALSQINAGKLKALAVTGSTPRPDAAGRADAHRLLPGTRPAAVDVGGGAGRHTGADCRAPEQ